MLCFSIRPLTVDELIDAHAVDLGEMPHLDRDGRSYEQDDLIDICLGLIEIAATEDDYGQSISTVRIAHFSVQEYLQSDRISQHESRKVRRFAMQGAPAHTVIAQICLVYLLEPKLSTGALNKTKLTDFPLAHFAAMHWFHHYAKCGEGRLEIERLVLALFKSETKSFVTWIRLHDMDHPRMIFEDYDRPTVIRASPVYYAALLGLDSVLDSILAIRTRDASVSDMVNAQGGYNGNALQAASSKGHERVVQMLLDQGANVNAQGGYFGGAIEAAAFHGYEKVVQMLLDRGADVNAQGRYGNALQAASSNGHERVVQMLLDRGANINDQTDLGNALRHASYNGHEKVVQMLLNRGADINAQGGDYGSALEAASDGGHEQVVQILLDRGANINAQGGYYGSALEAASFHGYEKVVRMLLDRGADVNSHGEDYGNALQAAADGGHEKVVQMLLDRGADVNAQGRYHGSALEAASDGGHEKVVQMLLDRGADVNAHGEDYGYALQAAANGGHETVMQMLLDWGAKVHLQGVKSDPP
jgi:ankyrin repeat protein